MSIIASGEHDEDSEFNSYRISIDDEFTNSVSAETHPDM